MPPAGGLRVLDFGRPARSRLPSRQELALADGIPPSQTQAHNLRLPASPPKQRNAKKDTKGKISKLAVLLNEASDTEAFNSPAQTAVSSSASVVPALPSLECSSSNSRPSTPIEPEASPLSNLLSITFLKIARSRTSTATSILSAYGQNSEDEELCFTRNMKNIRRHIRDLKELVPKIAPK